MPLRRGRRSGSTGNSARTAPGVRTRPPESSNRARLPFKIKVPDDPDRFDRCDSAVVYVPKDACREAADLLADVYRQVSLHLKPETPVFTKRLAPGVGLAEDPGRSEISDSTGVDFWPGHGPLSRTGRAVARRKTEDRHRMLRGRKPLADHTVPQPAPRTSTPSVFQDEPPRTSKLAEECLAAADGMADGSAVRPSGSKAGAIGWGRSRVKASTPVGDRTVPSGPLGRTCTRAPAGSPCSSANCTASRRPDLPRDLAGGDPR